MGRERIYPPGIGSCPSCGSEELQRGEPCTTLIGFRGGPERDPNRWSRGLTCKACGEKFVENWVHRDQSYWVYDKNKHVRCGEPTCCETNLTLPCRCGGKLAHITSLEAKKKGDGLSVLVFDIGKDGATPHQSMYRVCDSCDVELPDKQFGVFKK